MVFPWNKILKIVIERKSEKHVQDIHSNFVSDYTHKLSLQFFVQI